MNLIERNNHLNPNLPLQNDQNKEVTLIHPLMEVTELVCIIFEYSMSSNVCGAFPTHDRAVFYATLKKKYDNIHITNSFGNSLNSILNCLNFEDKEKPEEYCLAASQKVREFIKNKLLFEIAILENHDLYSHNSLKSQFYNTIKVKNEKLKKLNEKPDLFITEEIAQLDRQLDKSNEIIFNSVKSKVAIPPEFENLKQLCTSDKYLNEITSLDLSPASENQTLTILPTEIGQLKYLRNLNITNNHIQYLPSSINDLQKLICLKAASNNLQQLPMHFPTHLNLLYLDLNYNKLGNLNHILPSLLNVETLGLSFEWHGKVSENIKNLTYLKTLHFDNLDLLFPFLDHFLNSQIDVKIFTSLNYLESNAHLLKLSPPYHTHHYHQDGIKRITINTYQENGIPLKILKKIKKHKAKLEMHKKEEFKKEKKVSCHQIKQNHEVNSRTCIIS